MYRDRTSRSRSVSVSAMSRSRSVSVSVSLGSRSVSVSVSVGKSRSRSRSVSVSVSAGQSRSRSRSVSVSLGLGLSRSCYNEYSARAWVTSVLHFLSSPRSLSSWEEKFESFQTVQIITTLLLCDTTGIFSSVRVRNRSRFCWKNHRVDLREIVIILGDKKLSSICVKVVAFFLLSSLENIHPMHVIECETKK